MSEFDFLARIPLGQYVSTGSVMHRLDPRAKITIFLVLILALTFSQSLLGLGIGLAFLILLTFLSKIQLKFALKSVLVPLPFLLFFAAIQVFFYSSKNDPQLLVLPVVPARLSQRINRRRNPAVAILRSNPGAQPRIFLHIHIRAHPGDFPFAESA